MAAAEGGLEAAATTGAAALDALISAAATDRDAVADMVREAALVKRPKNCRSNRIGNIAAVRWHPRWKRGSG
jgi:hypothetical protein